MDVPVDPVTMMSRACPEPWSPEPERPPQELTDGYAAHTAR